MRWKPVLTAVAVAGVAMLGPLAWVRGWLEPVLAPLATALSPPGDLALSDPAGVLREQVARLAAENAELRERLSEFQAIQGEGGIPPARLVVARGRIIARTRRTGRRFLELDVGRVDGVQKGMAVTLGWTLIGQVSGTDDGRCLVQEVGDGESRIAAAVVDPGGPALNGVQPTPPKRLAEGVLAGHGQRARFTLDFVEASPDLELVPNLAVVTAGADGRFPAGLVLGKIVSATHAGTESWQVEVAPARDAELAESVLILRFTR
jgi:cell shape-determining protein MreC